MQNKPVSKKRDPIAALRRELTEFFARRGLPVRIIYRTCQSKFVGEPPHKLHGVEPLPRNIRHERISI